MSRISSKNSENWEKLIESYSEEVRPIAIKWFKSVDKERDIFYGTAMNSVIHQCLNDDSITNEKVFNEFIVKSLYHLEFEHTNEYQLDFIQNLFREIETRKTNDYHINYLSQDKIKFLRNVGFYVNLNKTVKDNFPDIFTSWLGYSIDYHAIDNKVDNEVLAKYINYMGSIDDESFLAMTRINSINFVSRLLYHITPDISDKAKEDLYSKILSSVNSEILKRIKSEISDPNVRTYRHIKEPVLKVIGCILALRELEFEIEGSCPKETNLTSNKRNKRLRI